MKDGIHEVSGCVSGEGTAGAVAAVGSRSETEDEDAGGGISEAGDGTGPVVVLEIGSALLAADALAVFDEARTEAAGDYVALEDG
jgi:hypothetical protein